MKIIILSDDFPPKSGGGAAIIAHIHAQAMVSNGYEVIVITTVENKIDVGEVVMDGIKIIRLYSKYNPRWRSYLSIYNPSILPKLKKILQKEKADIIHAHNIHYHLSYHSLSLAKKYSKSLFVTIHDSMPFHYSKLFPAYPFNPETQNCKVSKWKQLRDFGWRFNPFRSLLIRYYLSLPDKLIAVSGALKKALYDNGIKNVEVINNGIDIKKWQIDTGAIERFKEEHNLINKKVILFCGRLSRAKGGEVLMKSMPVILNKIPNAVLLIVGEKSVEVSGNDSYLVFTGKLSGNSIIEAYGASDILVSPSLCYDWFPTVNLEAMAMKLPVVSTCFGGSREVVSGGISGFIINPYNTSELENRIIEILKNDDLARKMGQAGYDIIRDKFNIENYINKTINLYDKFR